MTPGIALACAVVVVAADTASAQVVTWYWTISDTGNGDGLIEPGESALLSLWVGFLPRQDLGAFAGDSWNSYDIVGNEEWGAGTVDHYLNLLDWFGLGPGDIDEDNNIRSVMHFQRPPQFVDCRTDNPIDLFLIRWTPEHYVPSTVTLDNSGPAMWIYTDRVGNDPILYAGAGGSVTFHIVPSPSAAALLALGAFGAFRRRR